LGAKLCVAHSFSIAVQRRRLRHRSTRPGVVNL
jgi:hypothetical protein